MVPLAGPFSIGRGKTNDLVLEDTRVSRTHAMLRPSSRSSYFLLDLGSSNGTFLNGKLVTIPAELKDGDAITIGGHGLRFRTPAKSGKESDEGMVTAQHLTSSKVSILVADVRGFVKLSEMVPQKELSTFIGSWFKDASAAVESHGGVIDKYIGDAVMAYWKAGPDASKAAGWDLASGALKSALELQETAALYDGQLRARHPELRFGVGCGIHAGEATFGSVGSSARRDFTPMGDCVNTAFRLQSLAKELDKPIVVSEPIKAATVGLCAFEDLGPRPLKGKAEELRVFAARPKSAVQ